MSDETLHVKFQRGEIVIELEGPVAAVHAELLALKTEGYGRLPEFFGDSSPVLGSPPVTAPEPAPGPTPGTQPAPETALMPIVAPARTLRFVVSSLIVPLQRSDFAADLN